MCLGLPSVFTFKVLKLVDMCAIVSLIVSLIKKNRNTQDNHLEVTSNQRTRKPQTNQNCLP